MTDQNFFPWDEIPDSSVLPDGVFQMEYTKLEDGMSQSTNKRMFRAQFTVQRPEQFAGMSHFENFVTGNDENLGAIVPGSMGTRSLKQSLSAAQVPANNDIAVICDFVNVNKPVLMMSISLYKEASGEYKGQERNRVVGWHKVGERDAGLAPRAGDGAPGMPAAPSAPAAPAPVQQTPTAAAPQPQTAAPAPAAPVAQVPAPPQAGQPVAQTTQAPPAAPQAAAPTQTAAPAPAPNAGLSGQTIPCSVPGCGQQVPVEQFSEHVQQHQLAAQQG